MAKLVIFDLHQKCQGHLCKPGENGNDMANIPHLLVCRIFMYIYTYIYICQRQIIKPVKCPSRFYHALSIWLVIIGYINHSQGYDKMELYHAIPSCQHTYFMNSRLGTQTIESPTTKIFHVKYVEPLLYTSIEFYPLIISDNEHIPVATGWQCFVAVLQCPFWKTHLQNIEPSERCRDHHNSIQFRGQWSFT